MIEYTTEIERFESELPRLENETMKEPSQELYSRISRGNDHRLGVVIMATREGSLGYSIELLVRVSSDRNELQVPFMESTIGLFRELRTRDYSITYEDEGWLLCQKPLSRDLIVDECFILIRLIREFRTERERSIPNGKGREQE